jgi:hypothetical protein
MDDVYFDDVEQAIAEALDDANLTAGARVKGIVADAVAVKLPTDAARIAARQELASFPKIVRTHRLACDPLGLLEAAVRLRTTIRDLARPVPPRGVNSPEPWRQQCLDDALKPTTKPEIDK